MSLKVIYDCDYSSEDLVFSDADEFCKLIPMSTYKNAISIDVVNGHLAKAFDGVFIDEDFRVNTPGIPHEYHYTFLKIVLFLLGSNADGVLRNVDYGLRYNAIIALFDLIEEVSKTRNITVITSSPMLLNMCDIEHVYKCDKGVLRALVNDQYIREYAEQYSIGNLLMGGVL